MNITESWNVSCSHIGIHNGSKNCAMIYDYDFTFHDSLTALIRENYIFRKNISDKNCKVKESIYWSCHFGLECRLQGQVKVTIFFCNETSYFLFHNLIGGANSFQKHYIKSIFHLKKQKEKGYELKTIVIN